MRDFYQKYLLKDYEVYQITGDAGRFMLYLMDYIAYLIGGIIGILISFKLENMLGVGLTSIIALYGLYSIIRKGIGRILFLNGMIKEQKPISARSFGISYNTLEAIRSDRYSKEVVRCFLEILLGVVLILMAVHTVQTAENTSDYHLFLILSFLLSGAIMYDGFSRYLKYKRVRILHHEGKIKYIKK